MANDSSINVEVEITIDAKPEQVFSALTTGVSMWWGNPYLERADATDLVLEPKLGGRFYERWGQEANDHHGSLLGRITAIDRPRLLRMIGQFGITTVSAVAVVSIELHRLEDGTHLKFFFNALGDFDEPTRLRYGRGWHDLLGRLKYHVEGGHAHGVRYDPSLSETFEIE
jgi:uncharacterized protein YndB with AHSA1/START domain